MYARRARPFSLHLYRRSTPGRSRSQPLRFCLVTDDSKRACLRPCCGPGLRGALYARHRLRLAARLVSVALGRLFTGVPVHRLRATAVAASGAVAGLAGALAVQLAGVGDPSQQTRSLVPALRRRARGWRALAARPTCRDARARCVVPRRRRSRAPGERRGRACAHAADRDHAARHRLTRLGRDRPPGAARAARCTRLRRTSPATLEATGLRKSFESLAAADGVALTVEPGQITALVGPNGMGTNGAGQLLRTVPQRQVIGLLPCNCCTLQRLDFLCSLCLSMLVVTPACVQPPAGAPPAAALYLKAGA